VCDGGRGLIGSDDRVEPALHGRVYTSGRGWSAIECLALRALDQRCGIGDGDGMGMVHAVQLVPVDGHGDRGAFACADGVGQPLTPRERERRHCARRFALA